jgi:hypothetical protein
MQESMNIIQHITVSRTKPTTVSIDSLKAFEKIQHLFTVRALSKLGTEGI